MLPFMFASTAGARTPMDYLRSAGPVADPVVRLNWGLLTVSMLVMVIIGALLLYASLRRRPPQAPDAAGRSPIGAEEGGMAWIYIGVGISALVLLGSVVWTLMTLSAVAAPRTPALAIEVVAHQFWWEARYLDGEPARTFTTANEIHIPAGAPVHVTLRSDDVIHSFWVPKLAGKTDVIPGQTNHAWLHAHEPGIYRGQCGEYCGAQHAHMAFHVVAQDSRDFEEWRQAQLRDGAQPQSQQALHGRELFLIQCGMCHTVRGTSAMGKLGPDLTHLMSRGTIAAGMLPNTTGSLNGWIAAAPEIKPGTLMPGFKLDPKDLHAVVSYLQTLE